MNYLFISNSTEPTLEQYVSRIPVSLGNYSSPCVEAALRKGMHIYYGINRKYAEEIKCVNYPQIKFYDSSIYRNPFALRKVYNASKKLIHCIKKNQINVIHCNAPIGGVLGRICGHKEHVSKIIYTVHGFHFIKGGNVFFNFVFYNIEKLLSSFTDAIITINEEDYCAALKMTCRKTGTQVYKVHGVGIDVNALASIKVDRISYRNSIGLSEKDFVIITTGDLNKNKNQSVIIQALAKINNPNIHLLICGIGNKRKTLEKLCRKLNVASQIHFLGYRRDIPELLKCSDLFTLSSYREGLPRSTMEAMAIGLSCVVSKVRGNVDLIDQEYGGFLCPPNNVHEFAVAINKLYERRDLLKQQGEYNQGKIKAFDISVVKEEIMDIYNEVI